MSQDTTTTIVGNCTRPPEARFTASGANITSFGVAVNTRRKEGNEWVDGDPMFFDVKCWGSLATNVADSVTQGMRLVVTGELEYRSWDADDGSKRSKVEIKAEAVGPDLRWATAQVTKTTGSGASATASRPIPEANPFA